MEWYLLNINPNYEITKTGLIRNIHTKYVLIQQERLKYLRVRLNYGDCKTYSVHRLVAEQFIPNPENKLEVNHKDFNTKNNNVENLEWVTRQENNLHKMSGEHGERLKQQMAFNIVEYGVKTNEKPVLQYDLDHNFLQEYRSMIEAERQTGVNRKMIRFCVRKQMKSSGGFLWELKEGSTTIENNLEYTSKGNEQSRP